MPREKFDRSLIPPSPDLRFETAFWGAGCLRLAGLDEAGRGALAGPVAAAAVILPPSPDPQAAAAICQALAGVRDSKEMSPVARAASAECIRRVSAAWAVGLASAAEIDALGIVPATRLAMQRALDSLPVVPEALLVDFLDLPGVPLPQTPLVKGDARSLTIAAASVLAKTARDTLMTELDQRYPGYHFAVHKGYGTVDHRRCLAAIGPSPIHRRTFAPLAHAREAAT